ncbi:hypothetical protein KO566_06935 [Flavobacteriaceae bacterium XHP0103]|uniref:hypothetical protein n=1 Tax=Marixanthotalea marina TaxID=2844359 RepID=UPI00298A0063|nr:hypothetical protein [Marixanthotalea marina]MBU3821790.1 hypothetical protein [Marixanthotalea marina]
MVRQNREKRLDLNQRLLDQELKGQVISEKNLYLNDFNQILFGRFFEINKELIQLYKMLL